MDFFVVLDQVLTLLRQRQRVTYRALQRQFQLDEETLNDLKDELLYAHPQIRDDAERGLVWADEADITPPAAAPPPTAPERIPLIYTPRYLAEKVLVSRTALEGERKQVTVLFTDVSGFTSISAQLDPEEVHQLMNRAFGLMLDEVHRYEGTINQFLGDGIMALFGAPIAHEDHAQRAVHAALAIQHALRGYHDELQRTKRIAFRLRMGLNTGLVVIASIGDNLRMDYTAIGDTTNLAARMLSLAEPGQVVIAEDTHKAVSGYFVTRPLGAQAIKGKAAPVNAYEVVRARGLRTRLEVGAEQGLTPFVGREPELSLLQERWAEARAGRGQVICLMGEAGIGKSRLLLEFQRRLVDEPMTWLTGRCISYGKEMAYLPIIDLLKHNFQVEEGDDDATMSAKIERGMEALGAELQPALPPVKYLLSVPPGDDAVLSLDAQQRRLKLFEALRAMTLQGGQRRPLILAARVLLLVTYRPGYENPFGERTYTTRIGLRTLSDHDSLRLTAGMLAMAEFPPELRDLILRKAEGNPFFLEEVLKSLLEVGALRQRDGRYILTKPISEIYVPHTIQDVIMARIDRLEESPKRVLQLASVIGREFTVRLLDRISDLQAQLEQFLQELKVLEFIYERHFYPELAYRFKHALTHDVAYNSLLMQRRQALHRVVAMAIEELYANRLLEYYEMLAYHYERREVWEKALEYLIKAGQKAQQAYANQEALEHYNRALQVCERLGIGLADERSGDLRLQRGRIYAQTGAIAQARADFEAALEGSRTSGNRVGELQALYALGSYGWATDYRAAISLFEAALPIAEALDDTASQVSLLSRLSIVYLNRLQIDQAFEHGRRALALARELGDQRALALAMDSLQVAATMIGDFTTIDEIAPQLAELHRRTGDLWYLQFALHLWGYVPIGAGQWDDAVARFEEVLAINRRIGDRGNEPNCLATLGWIHRSRGDYQQALIHGRQAVVLSEALGIAESTAWNEACLGWTLLELYAIKEAVQHLRRGVEAAEGAGVFTHLMYCIGQLAWAYWLLQETARARALAEQAEAIFQQITVPAGRAFLLGVHAYIAVARVRLVDGEAERAKEILAPVLAAAEACGWQEAIAYGALVVGQCLAARGDEYEAESVLQRALQVTQEVSLPGVAWQVHAALADFHRAARRFEAAENHWAQAKALIERLAITLDDEAIRQGFLNSALSNFGRMPFQFGC